MTNATVKIEIKSVSYYPVITEEENVSDRTYVTYLLNGMYGDIEIDKHTEDAQEIIEYILEGEKTKIRSTLIGSYEVEL